MTADERKALQLAETMSNAAIRLLRTEVCDAPERIQALTTAVANYDRHMVEMTMKKRKRGDR